MVELPLESRQKVNDFITRVFNYYNGRINIFNLAVLQIEWSLRLDSTNGATARNPNIVTIFPLVTARYSDDIYWFYHNLIISIIHELFHTDQVVCYVRMYEPEYCKAIESVVEMETYLYIANNQSELQREFGFVDRVPYMNYYPAIESTFETGRLYQRRDYRTHCIAILQDLLHKYTDELINEFDKAFCDMTSVIYCKINDKSFILKNKDLCMPVMQLNQILYEEYYRYNLRGSRTKFISDFSTNEHLLMVRSDCSNYMGKIYRP